MRASRRMPTDARAQPFGSPELLEWIFLVFLAISQVYYGFRYLLKYNSDATSPTYSSTPALFEAAKYGIAVALLVLSVGIIIGARGRTRRIDRNTLIFLLWTGGFVAYCLGLGVTFFQGSDDVAGAYRVIKGLFFFPLLALVPFHYAGWQSLRKYFRIVVILGCAYHIAYSGVEILAWGLYDRLPALAYPGGLVRFGGGWDDPNDFGGFLVLVLLFVISDGFFSRRNRLLLAAVLVPLLALTVSLAALAALVGAILCYVALRRKWWWVIGCAVVVGAVLLNPTVRDLIAFAWQAKEGSVEGHLTDISLSSFFADATLTQILFGIHGSGAAISESFFTALLEDFGCLGALWFVAIVLATVINAVIKARRCEAENDHLGAETFRVLAAFVSGLTAASVGIAYYYVFPVNVYLWVAIFAIWLTHGPSTAAAPAADAHLLGMPPARVMADEPSLDGAGVPVGGAGS